jgi:hypothetical protein
MPETTRVTVYVMLWWNRDGLTLAELSQKTKIGDETYILLVALRPMKDQAIIEKKGDRW